MDTNQLVRELNFKAVRSSGPGGQHVNKVSSKIELTFNIQKSSALSPRQKEILSKNLTYKITKDKNIILFCDESRSQHKNKELAIKRFIALIRKNIVKPKFRKATKPTRSSILKKKDHKKHLAQKKSMRKKITL